MCKIRCNEVWIESTGCRAFARALQGLGGRLLRGTNEDKALRLILQGIRVKLSPGHCPQRSSQPCGRA